MRSAPYTGDNLFLLMQTRSTSLGKRYVVVFTAKTFIHFIVVEQINKEMILGAGNETSFYALLHLSGVDQATPDPSRHSGHN